MYVPVSRGVMVKSRKYRLWIEKNLPIIKETLSKAEHFPITIEIFIVGGRDFNSRNDLDNSCKALVDLLVRAEIVPDDSTKYIDDIKLRFLPGSRKGEPLTSISYTEPGD
jgi:Holliday junction resolvase RusA-like endonuclease